MNIEVSNLKACPDGRVLTKDAAAYLGLSHHTLAAMRSKGTGPRFFKRGKVFYFIADLDAWVQEGAATTTTKARDANHHCGEGEPIGEVPHDDH